MSRRLAAIAITVTLAACGGDDGVDPGPIATGDLGPWVAGPAMPLPRANHASAVIGDDLVVIGGNYRPAPGDPFVKTDTIHAAAIADDGSLGAWRELGRTPSPVTECAAAVWGDTLLVIDGIYDDDTKGGQVWASVRNPDGTLGAFASLGALPAGLRAISSEAWVAGDTLYVTSGRLPADGDTLLLLSAPLGATPLVWTELVIVPAPGWRGQPQYAFTGDAIHVIGGYQGGTTAVIADVAWARLDRGVATPAGAEPALPAPTAAGEAIAVDDFVFQIGGKPMVIGSAGVTATYGATLGADGALGPWTANEALPVGRTNHDLALGPTHLYLTGGALDAGGLDTVFAAQVRFEIAEAH